MRFTTNNGLMNQIGMDGLVLFIKTSSPGVFKNPPMTDSRQGFAEGRKKGCGSRLEGCKFSFIPIQETAVLNRLSTR